MKTGLLEFLQNKTLQKLFRHASTNNIWTYAVGKRIGEITAKDLALGAGLEKILQTVIVHRTLKLSIKFTRVGAVRLYEGSVNVLGSDILLSLLHCTAGVELPVGGRLHNFVESLIWHCSADEELAGADVVQRQWLYLGDVDTHLPMDAGALDTHDHTKVSWQPRDIVGASTITAQVVGRNIPNIVH